MADGDYDDIISLPHHVSSTRPHMSDRDRAAQFAPFAALVGFEEAVNETGRLTDEESEISDELAEEINYKIYSALSDPESRAISVTYFERDKKKSGGKNFCHSGTLKTIDVETNSLIFTDGFKIPISAIKDVAGDAFI